MVLKVLRALTMLHGRSESKIKGKFYKPLIPSVLGHIFTTSFGCDETTTLGGVYGGQKIDGESLYYYNSHMIFRRCMKLINNKQNIYEKHSSTEGVNIKVDSIAVVSAMLSPLIHILKVSRFAFLRET